MISSDLMKSSEVRIAGDRSKYCKKININLKCQFNFCFIRNVFHCLFSTFNTTTYSVLLSVSAFGIGRYQKLYICILSVSPIRKLYLSAHICIGWYEKMLIVCSLPNAIINNALWEKADLYTYYLCTIGFFSEFFWTQNKRIILKIFL